MAATTEQNPPTLPDKPELPVIGKAVEVAGEMGTGTRQELPAQGYDHEPYEMPGQQVG